MARANPQWRTFDETKEALVIFQGPHSYVSPSWYGDEVELSVPTWNYSVVRFEVTVAFVPDEIDAAVERLAAHLEHARHDPWRVEELGGRYDQLRQHIIAFRAHVRAMRATFKLGQDEEHATFNEIVAGLDNTPLGQLMSEQGKVSRR